MAKGQQQDQFADILMKAEDITERFFVDLGGLPQDILANAQGFQPYLQILRAHLEKHLISVADGYVGGPGMLYMHEWSHVAGDEIRDSLATGRIAAIDGTPVINHQVYLTGEVFACAVGSLTSREHDVKARVVKTYNELGIEPQTLQDVFQVAVAANELSGNRSWPMAFMEYLERYTALEVDTDIAIIDGQLITQNLLTRRPGRDLLERMYGSERNKRYVGVIKDIRKSGAFLRFWARALQAGELYIHHTVNDHMKDRLRDDYGGTIQAFSESIGSRIIRGVYKPGVKAFGFECHVDDLAHVVALLWLDRNDQAGYEVPFLLAQVDARIRGQYRPNETTEAINGTLTRYGEHDYFDESSERSLR